MNPLIEYYREHKHSGLTGAELGIGEGANAKNMLVTLDINKLYLVDPYIPYNDNYESKYIITRYVNSYPVLVGNLLGYEDKYMFINKSYMDAVDDIPDDLDFVYFDATGLSEPVKIFLRLYYPKIRMGGCLFGRRLNVSRMTLDEFVVDNGLNIISFSPPFTDYWMIFKT